VTRYDRVHLGIGQGHRLILGVRHVSRMSEPGIAEHGDTDQQSGEFRRHCLSSWLLTIKAILEQADNLMMSARQDSGFE
jgi:hypothetical protein